MGVFAVSFTQATITRLSRARIHTQKDLFKTRGELSSPTSLEILALFAFTTTSSSSSRRTFHHRCACQMSIFHWAHETNNSHIPPPRHDYGAATSGGRWITVKANVCTLHGARNREIYGALRRWKTARFYSVLAGLFCIRILIKFFSLLKQRCCWAYIGIGERTTCSRWTV